MLPFLCKQVTDLGVYQIIKVTVKRISVKRRSDELENNGLYSHCVSPDRLLEFDGFQTHILQDLLGNMVIKKLRTNLCQWNLKCSFKSD